MWFAVTETHLFPARRFQNLTLKHGKIRIKKNRRPYHVFQQFTLIIINKLSTLIILKEAHGKITCMLMQCASAFSSH